MSNIDIDFGDRLQRKVEKFRNPAVFWEHARTYCQNTHNVMILGHFFALPSFW